MLHITCLSHTFASLCLHQPACHVSVNAGSVMDREEAAQCLYHCYCSPNQRLCFGASPCSPFPLGTSGVEACAAVTSGGLALQANFFNPQVPSLTRLQIPSLGHREGRSACPLRREKLSLLLNIFPNLRLDSLCWCCHGFCRSKRLGNGQPYFGHGQPGLPSAPTILRATECSFYLNPGLSIPLPSNSMDQMHFVRKAP